nr:MAG TPA: hypothetical protein [Caudoviricetes sp.]
MLKIENTEVVGWEAAVRGMRNPMNSWEKSDSFFCGSSECCFSDDECNPGCAGYGQGFNIGEADFDLMTRLRNSGTDHRKFMRMIVVYLDITAPLYWWKEFDTYKVGTVTNSCSTMHKIADKEFTIDDFSIEHLNDDRSAEVSNLEWFEHLITHLNRDRKRFIETKDKQYWWQLIQLLPSSYNQRRTVMLNYEVLANIYKSRRNHKLDEWHTFCDWIESLPYSELITGNKEE